MPTEIKEKHTGRRSAEEIRTDLHWLTSAGMGLLIVLCVMDGLMDGWLFVERAVAAALLTRLGGGEVTFSSWSRVLLG